MKMCCLSSCTNPGTWFVRAALPVPNEPPRHVGLGVICKDHHGVIGRAGAPTIMQEEFKDVFVCMTRGRYIRSDTTFFFSPDAWEIELNAA